MIYRGLKEFVPKFVPAGKKPIGYLIFLSPLFFFFWGQIWGQNERNPESMGISGIFHLSPYFEGGDKRSEKPYFTGVFKGSILSPIFLFWGQTGTKWIYRLYRFHDIIKKQVMNPDKSVVDGNGKENIMSENLMSLNRLTMDDIDFSDARETLEK